MQPTQETFRGFLANESLQPPSPPQQTITFSGAGWTAGQWTSPDAHLAYVSDSAGNEEAFLILSNTTDTLTIQREFELLDSARNISTTAPVAIREAHHRRIARRGERELLP